MKKSTRYYSNNQEKQVAKTLGGRQQINSGATPFYKGDVVTDYALIECKTTTTPKNSFSIKKEWLEKLRQERFEARKELEALVFEYEPNGTKYCVITLTALAQLLENKRELENNENI